MAEIIYTYSINEDFPNSIVNTTTLTLEIQISSITIALSHINTNDDNCDIVFKSELSINEQSLLDNIVFAHTGANEEPEPTSIKLVESDIPLGLDLPKTNANILRVVSEKTDIDRITLITHNWADSTTWYEQSIRVVDEIPANMGDNKSYKLNHTYIIDTYHGKIFGEDILKNSDGYNYRVSIKVNEQLMFEQDPHYGTGGDFIINYVDGYIDFINELSPSDEVKVTYCYQNGSRFTLKPPTSKEFKLTLTEVQFSSDIELSDTMIFATYGYAGIFAPQLGYPFTTLIPIQIIKYKTIQDYIADSVRSYPIISALGGNNWRGMNHDIIIFDWDYVSAATLHSTYGMETRIYLEHNIPIQGSYATATFYCTIESCSH